MPLPLLEAKYSSWADASLSRGRISLGVSLLDKLLPHGLPRRSFVLFAGEGGAGKSLIVQLIASSMLRRGEKVVYVCLDDDPESVVESMESRGIDARSYADEGKLVFVDGYGARYGLESEDYVAEKLSSLDTHAAVATIQRLVDANSLRNSGLVVIDSLNPFLLRYEPTVVYDFVNMLRVSLAKRRSVPTLATLHTPSQLYAEIAAILEHMVDVFAVVRYHSEALEAGVAVREILVKKAKGAPISQGWTSFVITDEGLVEARVRVKNRELDVEPEPLTRLLEAEHRCV